jgi:hypothetical protein
VDTLARVLGEFDDAAFDGAAIRAHAEQFAPERFRMSFAAAVQDAVAKVAADRKP